jgi:hypothetical protein
MLDPSVIDSLYFEPGDIGPLVNVNNVGGMGAF